MSVTSVLGNGQRQALSWFRHNCTIVMAFVKATIQLLASKIDVSILQLDDYDVLIDSMFTDHATLNVLTASEYKFKYTLRLVKIIADGQSTLEISVLKAINYIQCY